MATDLEKWNQQWRVAERGLLQQKIAELSSMTDEQARAISSSLLSLAADMVLSEQRLRSSGLVEQQRFFQNARTQSHLPRRS